MRYIVQDGTRRVGGRRWLRVVGVIASSSMPMSGQLETGGELPSEDVALPGLAAVDEKGKRIQENIQKLADILAKKDSDKAKLKESREMTEAERTETERRLLWGEATAHELRIQMELKQLREAHKLKPEQVELALKDATTLVLPVRDVTTNDNYMQAFKFEQSDFENLKEFAMNISEDHLRQKFQPAQAEQMIALKSTNPKQYMTVVLVELCNRVESVRSWVFKQADELHPLYLPDGKFDRSKLPSDLWDVVELKGVGEVPYLKSDKNLLPIAKDNFFFQKLLTSSMVDRRFLNAEFDPTSNPSTVGRVITVIQSAVERHYKMVRPADKDKDYYFSLEKDVPFTGTPTHLDDDTLKRTGQFLVAEPLGKIFGNVPDDNKPSRALLRIRAIDLLADMKSIRSFAQGAFTKKEDDKSNSPLKKSATAALHCTSKIQL